MDIFEEKPMHISAISKANGMERRLVSYHLLTLEEHGFLTSKYEIFNAGKLKGRVLRIYQVTDKVDTVLSEFKKL